MCPKAQKRRLEDTTSALEDMMQKMQYNKREVELLEKRDAGEEELFELKKMALVYKIEEAKQTSKLNYNIELNLLNSFFYLVQFCIVQSAKYSISDVIFRSVVNNPAVNWVVIHSKVVEVEVFEFLRSYQTISNSNVVQKECSYCSVWHIFCVHLIFVV